MAYCITFPTSVRRYFPFFDLLDQQGNEFHFNSWVRLDSGSAVEVGANGSPILFFTSAKLVSAHKSLPIFFSLSGFICIENSARELIENLEFGMHQFIPIRLFRKNGVEFETKYYILNICQLVNAMNLKKSNLRIETSRDGMKYITRGLERVDYRTLNGQLIRSVHIWRETLFERDYYVSDRFVEMLLSLDKGGMRAWRYFKVREE